MPNSYPAKVNSHISFSVPMTEKRLHELVGNAIDSIKYPDCLELISRIITSFYYNNEKLDNMY